MKLCIKRHFIASSIHFFFISFSSLYKLYRAKVASHKNPYFSILFIFLRTPINAVIVVEAIKCHKKVVDAYKVFFPLFSSWTSHSRLQMSSFCFIKHILLFNHHKKCDVMFEFVIFSLVLSLDSWDENFSFCLILGENVIHVNSKVFVLRFHK